MGVVWSSPYRWQTLLVCSSMVVLVVGFIFLLLSIGLQNDTWRIMGGVCASLGTGLTLTGTCWCAWAVRHAKYHGDSSNIVECEVETLTSDVI